MTGLFFHSVGNFIIPIDSYVSEGLKPPTSLGSSGINTKDGFIIVYCLNGYDSSRLMAAFLVAKRNMHSAAS